MSFSIIIPSKSAANLVPCVQAIRDAGQDERIIVVDDGAATEFLKAKPETWYQSVAEPFCFARGLKPFCFSRNVNLGIRAAGDDDVIILNDDALLQSHRGFGSLAYVANANPQYGIIAASCDTVGNANQNRRGGIGRTLQPRDEPRMVCFVCVYIPRRTINAVGLLDERFVDYGMDDDDYSLRVRNASLKIGILDACYVDHGSLKSSYRSDPKAGGDFRPNLRRYIGKWGVDNRGKARAESEWSHLWPEVKS